jgi:transposase
MKIERNDARKVDQKTLQFLRNRAIKLREAGHSNKEVAAILGVAVETTSRWYSSYKKN